MTVLGGWKNEDETCRVEDAEAGDPTFDRGRETNVRTKGRNREADLEVRPKFVECESC